MTAEKVEAVEVEESQEEFDQFIDDVIEQTQQQQHMYLEKYTPWVAAKFYAPLFMVCGGLALAFIGFLRDLKNG